MAAGVQLHSDVHLTYFQPTVDQYLKKIEEAVASNDLGDAQNALSQLKKAVPSFGQPAQADGTSASGQGNASLHDVSTALDSGDLASAERAVNDLRQTLSTTKSRHNAGGPGVDDHSSFTEFQNGAQSDSQADVSSPGGSDNADRSLDVKA